MNFNKLKRFNSSSIKILFYLTFLVFVSCSNEISESDSEAIQYEKSSNSEFRHPSSETPNNSDNDEIMEDVVDKSYSEELTWRGYECTVDCSGHEAGYEWAEENSIDDVDDCQANSNSFNEGCQEYVEENE